MNASLWDFLIKVSTARELTVGQVPVTPLWNEEALTSGAGGGVMVATKQVKPYPCQLFLFSVLPV